MEARDRTRKKQETNSTEKITSTRQTTSPTKSIRQELQTLFKSRVSPQNKSMQDETCNKTEQIDYITPRVKEKIQLLDQLQTSLHDQITPNQTSLDDIMSKEKLTSSLTLSLDPLIIPGIGDFVSKASPTAIDTKKRQPA